MKKLINILFEEIEEVEDLDNDYEEEEEDFYVPTQTAPLPKQSEPVSIKSETVVHTPIIENEHTILEEPVKTVETKTIIMDVDSLLKVPSTPNLTQTVRKTTTDYEFTQVISPMFGVKGDYEDNEEYVVSKPLKRKAQNSSLLGTVISPIYGTLKDNTPTMPSYRHENNEDYVENISLDEIISAPSFASSADDAWDELQKSSIEEEDFESLVKTFVEAEDEVEKTVIESSRLNLFEDEK